MPDADMNYSGAMGPDILNDIVTGGVRHPKTLVEADMILQTIRQEIDDQNPTNWFRDGTDRCELCGRLIEGLAFRLIISDESPGLRRAGIPPTSRCYCQAHEYDDIIRHEDEISIVRTRRLFEFVDPDVEPEPLSIRVPVVMIGRYDAVMDAVRAAGSHVSMVMVGTARACERGLPRPVDVVHQDGGCCS